MCERELLCICMPSHSLTECSELDSICASHILTPLQKCGSDGRPQVWEVLESGESRYYRDVPPLPRMVCGLASSVLGLPMSRWATDGYLCVEWDGAISV